MAITERALIIYFCITEPKEFSLKKELNQKGTLKNSSIRKLFFL